MAGEESTRAVLAALAANLGLAVAKFVGFLVTGSSAMLAESVHSVADTSNQGLLLVGKRTSRRRATPEHPFGYGRDRYFYAFVVALLLFSLGSVFALYEGVRKVFGAETLTSPLVAVVILLVGIGLESLSLRTAVRNSRAARGTRSWWRFIRQAKEPELPIVLLEDSGALVGLVLALAGIGLTVLTGDPVWDGVATLGIGALLGFIAVTLIIETKSLLVGEGASAEEVRRIREALVGSRVSRVIHLRTEYLGPEELLVAAKIAVTASLSTREVAAAIDEAEGRLRAAVPVARLVYLEPDLDRG
ncbi:cation transporter [Actinoalloteichus sp. AHMU CJ021]|uniref:Cation diffusion facilitator family transporter n=1 Tax=Actinoalloteichus caeruleus DSM 43889 TaxID=1120930 RepID=A0ABT1JMF5_ACTCY|nr:cation diffusion facilitator family transporter [Actinoalloteichus caeruleus]AUS79405.1 cation transporter [Actinoalloteichus sp. AHMU CJ021]MCP2333712.1 cation diffusion facilitator family transporter [Actinoalloteichus caeruleus DSM 43889]